LLNFADRLAALPGDATLTITLLEQSLPIPTAIKSDCMSSPAGADVVPAAQQDAPAAAEAAVAAAAVATAAAPTVEVEEHPFETDPGDHAETPFEAYEHLDLLLTRLAK
jgi:hypothetical protein